MNFRHDARKLALGYRNTGDITPMVRGACLHKGNASPDAVCAASEGCGETYHARYGEPQAYQTGNGFTRDPVERSSANPYILTFATNSESLWASGSYAQAGQMEVCVSFDFFPVWRCQKVHMSREGRLEGFGSDFEAGYDVAK